MNFTSLLAAGNERLFVRDDLRAAMAELGTYTHLAWTAERQPAEAELLDALAGTDVFAGLDVYESEPLPADSPLNALDNAICYPHSVGGGGDEMYLAASAFAAANIRAFALGRPLAALIAPAQYDRMT
jgi:hypothetical protein